MADIHVTQSRLLVARRTNAPVDVHVTASRAFVLYRPPFLARILIYTSNTSDSTVASYANMLREGGFSVSVRDDANLTSDSVELVREYDAVFGLRLEESGNYGDELRAAAEAAERPFALWGFDGTATGTGLQPGPYDAKLTGTWEGASNGTGYIDITDATHEITESFGTGLLQVNAGSAYMWAVEVGQSVVGDALAEADDASSSFETGQPLLIAIETGTNDLTLTPIATTERSLALGFPWNNTAVTDDGKEIVWRAFTWLLNDKPLAPSIYVQELFTTYVSLATNEFEHLNPVREHAATRWQITLQTDTTWASPVYDSSYTTDLLEHTTPLGTLDPTEDYMARALHRDDFGIDSGWSAAVNLTTTDYGTGGAAGWLIEFRESDETLISKVERVTEATTWDELIEEGLQIPTDTAFIDVYPIKRGASSGGAAVKELSLDLGYISRGFAPYPFRPEVHTDEVIHAAHASVTGTEIDWLDGRYQSITVTTGTTVTFTNMQPGIYYLRVIQSGAGGHDITWPAAVQWASGTAPTMSDGDGKEDLFRLTNIDGTDIVGETVALDVSGA